MMKRPIGILDSGVGGLTVLHTIRSLLPQAVRVIITNDNIKISGKIRFIKIPAYSYRVYNSFITGH